MESHHLSSIRLWPLAIAHFFGVTALFAHVALTSIVTQEWIQLPNSDIPKGLATLPLALLILFSALSIAPAGRVMQRFGYRAVFVVGTLLGAASGALCLTAVVLQVKGVLSPGRALIFLSFSVVPQGCAYGIVHFYRHVAAIVGRLTAPPGSSPQQQTARSVAVVITSGAIAGLAGPGIADLTALIAGYPNAGAYLLLIVCSLLHTCSLAFTNVDAAFAAAGQAPPPPTAAQLLNKDEGKSITMVAETTPLNATTVAPLSPPLPRPLLAIVAQRDYFTAMLTATAAHGLMLVLMSVTPLLLHDRVHFAAGAAVIQVHVLCMYLPSFGTSKIVAKFGARRVAVVGLVWSACGAALLYVSTVNNWGYYAAVMGSLALIGLGWNFTYVSATTTVAGCYQANERFKAQSFNDTVVFTVGACLTLGADPMLQFFGIAALTSVCIALYAVTFVANVVLMVVEARSKT